MTVNALPARGEGTESQIDRLESDVRRINDKVDGFRVELAGRIEGVCLELTARIESVREELTASIENVREERTGQIKEVHEELSAIKASIASAKVWAWGLYIALDASLLLVMARGFQWIQTP